MGSEAKKLEAKEPSPVTPPDMSKPVRMKYWKSPEPFGTMTTTSVTEGGYLVDGTGGRNYKVKAIWFYPALGYAVAEVEMGWRPNTLPADQDVTTARFIITNGHGLELEAAK